MRFRPPFPVALSVCLPLLFAGCGPGGAASSADSTAPKLAAYPGKYPYTIVTTCSMVTDIVRHVAGDKANVVGLMGEGVDPHLYKATSNDVKQLMAADIVFYSGLMLEGRMSDTFTQVARTGKPVFAVTEGIDPSYLREPPEFLGHYDPHVWMDVSAWNECVALVHAELSKFDPPNAALYKENSERLRAQLKELDNYVKKVVASIPETQRVLVTAHDAFGYFSRAYGIPVRSVQGLTTESEPSVQDINDLVGFIVSRKVPSIFIESSVSEKNIRAVVEGARDKGWTVKIGGSLFSDAMGPEGTYEGTYIGMLDHNATLIARTLGGAAPDRGMQGKLK